MQPFALYQPSSEHELRELLASRSATLIAGGTDLLPRIRRGVAAPAVLVDLSRLETMKFIQRSGDEIVIGALVTHSDLLASPLIQTHAPSLWQAVATIGCPQTRNRGTLGGNLVNASPAADTAPPLITLDAVARLVGPASARDIPLEEFFLAPGRTQLNPGEYLHSVRFRLPRQPFRAIFVKLGKRKGMSIAVASLAVLLSLGENAVIETARIALGSLAPTVVRSRAAETCLVGMPLRRVNPALAAESVQADIFPISDVRASETYRRHSAQVLLRRALDLIKQMDGEDL